MKRHLFSESTQCKLSICISETIRGYFSETCQNVIIENAAGELMRCHRLDNNDRLTITFASCLLSYRHSIFSDQTEGILLIANQIIKTVNLNGQLENKIINALTNALSDSPANLAEEIICDAMNYPLAHFSFISSLNTITCRHDFVSFSTKQLTSHRWHSEYAQNYFNAGKQENLRRLHDYMRYRSITANIRLAWN